MDIAIIVKNIEMSQMAYLIDIQRKIHNISVYTIQPIENTYSYGMSIFSISELNYFKGDYVIATDVECCKFALNSIINTPILFYCFDLDWIRIKDFNYNDFAQVYQNHSLKLFCRSKYHSDIINKTWNTKCFQVEDFNINDMIGAT